MLSDAESGDIRLYKRLTTPEDPSVGALDGLSAITREAGLALAAIGEIVHGTTLVTNAVIERKGARLGLITTEGFWDVLEMGTEQRYDIYDLFLSYPGPLVERRARLEVRERMDRDGGVVTALDEGEVRRGRGDCGRRAVQLLRLDREEPDQDLVGPVLMVFVYRPLSGLMVPRGGLSPFSEISN